MRFESGRFAQFARQALPGALFVLLLCAVYADPLFARRNFAGRDLLAYNLPVEKAVHDAYARGRWPVWMPEISGGRPLLPNPNTGALYPVWALLSLVSFPLAVRIFPLLHWAAGGIGIMCLLRSLGGSKSAAWVSAVTYVFSGVVVSEVFYAHYMVGMALLPWILWVLAGPRAPRGKVLPLAILFALVFLSGDVFQIGIALGSAVIWTLAETDPSRRVPDLAAFGVSIVLAALAAAPQIVATALWIPETGRAVTGMKLGESLLFSVSPFRLLELIVPYPFGATFSVDTSEVWTRNVFHGKAIGLFTTLYAGGFAVIGAVALRRERPRGARFGRILGLVALVLAVAPSLIPAGWRNFPSPIPLRNPEKFAVGLSLALAILAGLAFDRFRRAPMKSRGVVFVAVVLCLFAAAARLWAEPVGQAALKLVGESSGAERLAGEKLAAAFAEAGLLWVATLLALESLRLPSAAGPAVSLVLLTLMPVAANRRIAQTSREEAVFAPTPFARYLEKTDPHGEYRTLGATGYRPPSALEEANAANDPLQLEFSRRNWIEYTPALWERGVIFNTDFDSGDLSRLQSLRTLSRVAASYREASPFFGALALRWGIRFRDQDPLPGYHRVGGDLLMDWDEHERPYPDIRLLTDWREETGAVEALNTVPRLAAGQVVIESGQNRVGAARRGRLRIFEKSPERLRIEADAPDPTWLFVLRGLWNHREVLLDGRPVEDFPAQLAFSAVRVPAGRHAIEWRECVPGGSVSRWGPVLFALAAVLLVSSERLGFLRS